MRKLLIAFILLPFMAHAQFTVGAGYSTKNYADLFGRYNIGQNGIILGIGSQITNHIGRGYASYIEGSKSYSFYAGYSRTMVYRLGLKVICGYNRNPGYKYKISSGAEKRLREDGDILFGIGLIIKLTNKLYFEPSYLHKEEFVFDISFNL